MLFPLHNHTSKETFSAVGLIRDKYKDITETYLLKKTIYHV
jgi:hypothetical protein